MTSEPFAVIKLCRDIMCERDALAAMFYENSREITIWSIAD